MKKGCFFLGSILAVFVISCKQDPIIDVHEHNSHEHHDEDHVEIEITGFPNMEIPPENPTTEAGVNLGRHLFYSEAVSCKSCHSQSLAFSAPINLQLEIEGNLYDRSPMPLFNLGWVDKLAWDGRDTDGLEDKMTGSIEISSGKLYNDVLSDIRSESFDFASLYEEAFGDTSINEEYTNRALAQFLRTITASETRAHQYMNGDSTALTEQEISGFNIFTTEKGNCSHCHIHTNYLFTDNTMRNNGLDSVNSVNDFTDPGYYFETGIPFDKGKFRSVTLINIEKTGPYMHDGRFATLEDVVDHYNDGGKFAPNLDNVMNENPDVQGLGLTDDEKAALVAFLKTLTDQEMLVDTMYSDPF